MDAELRLRHCIEAQKGRLAAGIEAHREAALLAVLRRIDALPLDREVDDERDPLTGRAMPGLGVPLALRVLLEATGGPRAEPVELDGWAAAFLARCRALEAAALVLRFVETGAFRLAGREDGGLDAWPAGGRVPTLWRERADLDWWARWSVRQEPTPPTPSGPGALGAALVRSMAWQFPYPADGMIGGQPARAWREIVAGLVSEALAARNRGEALEAIDERALVAGVAAGTGLDPERVADAVAALTLDAGNAGWHAALPGGPLAPLVRLDANRLAWSLRGLLSEPFLYLTRELRRRDPDGYHNAAHMREEVFRTDLYSRFADRRFVTAAARIVLRWPDRRNRTDVDAAIFDRKTGTLALFELKSQDPFARSAEELARRQENLRRAGHQVGAVLDWINRHGADEVLSRVDAATAKRFRVQRVLAFVLGRYVADAGAGGWPDQRAAWGSWPQVLRLMEGGGGDASPLVALHARLAGDRGMSLTPTTDGPALEVVLGDTRLVVHASWGTARATRT